MSLHSSSLVFCARLHSLKKALVVKHKKNHILCVSSSPPIDRRSEGCSTTSSGLAHFPSILAYPSFDVHTFPLSSLNSRQTSAVILFSNRGSQAHAGEQGPPCDPPLLCVSLAARDSNSPLMRAEVPQVSCWVRLMFRYCRCSEQKGREREGGYMRVRRVFRQEYRQVWYTCHMNSRCKENLCLSTHA